MSPAVRGELRLDEPLARHTTWRVGGPAERFFRPADLEDLVDFLAALAADEPVFWLGMGSNLLVRDGGLRGTVVDAGGALNRIECLAEARVRVEAGVPSPKVARFCGRAGLVGAEFLTGIPGSFGGALAMNAGCWGSETWALVEAVETLDRRGGRHRREPSAYRVGYRRVEGPADEWFVAATLRLRPGDAAAASERMRELLERRAASQPLGQPNAGSVFRNPPGDHAGRLIEAAGLKGRCRGGACVSEKHANFIVNAGGARAADIEGLIEEVMATVERLHGVRLVPEVHIVGEPAQETRI